jgi:2-succinyl-5-enolpyruvyl-6-hydroxy-3-cyclohexene-1-carboxylate synthase
VMDEHDICTYSDNVHKRDAVSMDNVWPSMAMNVRSTRIHSWTTSEKMLFVSSSSVVRRMDFVCHENRDSIVMFSIDVLTSIDTLN